MIFGYVRFGHTVKCFKTSVVLNLHINGCFGRFWIELRADTLESLQAASAGKTSGLSGSSTTPSSWVDVRNFAFVASVSEASKRED